MTDGRNAQKGGNALGRGAKMRSEEDALGSYTGVTDDPLEPPVQDADDL
mgnify:CR=1 FL=1